MGGEICCRVLSVQFQLLLKVWMCRTPFGGSLVNVLFSVSLLVESSKVKAFRGTEAPGDGEAVGILLRGSQKLGLTAVYHSRGEPFCLFSLNALQSLISIHHMRQQLVV